MSTTEQPSSVNAIQHGWGWTFDLRDRWRIVSIERLWSDTYARGFRVEVCRYQMRSNDRTLWHNLIETRYAASLVEALEVVLRHSGLTLRQLLAKGGSDLLKAVAGSLRERPFTFCTVNLSDNDRRHLRRMDHIVNAVAAH